ncbi:methyl-accepting chemotaxis protein [Dapis sp. BLCC M172]|uniref:methyl-accepting chemotaxis protein n=1 Tax=Dapis sp. BLCC M172 TaxID=2975281 RepID=UPI003CEDBB41
MAQQITRLSEQTNQIGNISQLVGDLANQTNMLALNAAVEAVRAGEHGKGFGVVASEIRKLADESRKSAEKIYTLVADIQTSINSTVLATEAGT